MLSLSAGHSGPGTMEGTREELLKVREPQMSPSVIHPAPVLSFLVSGASLLHGRSLPASSAGNEFEFGTR